MTWSPYRSKNYNHFWLTYGIKFDKGIWILIDFTVALFYEIFAREINFLHIMTCGRGIENVSDTKNSYVINFRLFRQISCRFLLRFLARRSGTVWVRTGMVPSCQIYYQKFGESIFGKTIRKNLFSRSISHRSYSVTEGVAKLDSRFYDYWNHVVTHRQEWAARKLRSHFISPDILWSKSSIDELLDFKRRYLTTGFNKIYRRWLTKWHKDA